VVSVKTQAADSTFKQSDVALNGCALRVDALTMLFRYSCWMLTLLGLVFLEACKKPEQPATPTYKSAHPAAQPPQSTPEPAVPTAPAEKGVLLKVKWPVGNRYVCRMDLDQRSTNQFAQVPKPSEESLSFGVTYALCVLNDEPGGGVEVEVELLATEMELKVSGEVALHFDSTESPKDAAQERIAAKFQKLRDSRVRLLMGASGKVDQVVGHRDWAAHVAGAKPGALEQMLLQQFNEGFFRQLADFGRGLPEKAVQVGESWPFQTAFPAGSLGTITVDSTITLARQEDHDHRQLDVLDSQGVLFSTPAGNPSAPGSPSIESGTVSGTSWFDPEMGALVESSVVQSMRLKGELSDSSGEHKLPLRYTSDIDQTVTVKLVEIENPQVLSR
jgi:hypothetical protein